MQYRVLGLAKVAGWTKGYFHLKGYTAQGEVVSRSGPPLDALGMAAAPVISLEDARRRLSSSIIARQGAGAFRDLVLGGYGHRCALSYCDVVEVLEAAHIVPYLGDHTDKLENALLLRGKHSA